MNLNQIEVISKLFYGSNFKQWDLKLSEDIGKCNRLFFEIRGLYEQRVNKMMKEDLERFRACEKISNETGVHNDHDRFSDFMQA